MRTFITLFLGIMLLTAGLSCAQVSSDITPIVDNNVGTPDTNVGTPASDVGTPASNVGTPASDVGTPATDVGIAATQALPPQYTDEEMIYHVAGNVVDSTTDIKIVTPNADTQWISNATNTFSWTGTSPERFSVQLINDDTSILASGQSLRASIQTSDGSASCDVPAVKDSADYYIRFYDQLNVSVTVATSPKFSILKTATTTPQNVATSNATVSTQTDNKGASNSSGRLNAAGREIVSPSAVVPAVVLFCITLATTYCTH